MRIRKTNDFRIQNTFAGPDMIPKVSLHSRHLQEANVNLTGCVLEAQYGVGDDTLVMLTEGLPTEEALHIYLLDQALKIKDHLELSAPYTAGILKNLSASDRIYFSFFEDSETWALNIHDTPQWIVKGNQYPVKRKSGFFKKNQLALKMLHASTS